MAALLTRTCELDDAVRGAPLRETAGCVNLSLRAWSLLNWAGKNS